MKKNDNALVVEAVLQVSRPRASRHAITRMVRGLARALGFTNGAITVIVVGETTMVHLARSFLKKRGATNVLAFSYEKDAVRQRAVADIFICQPVLLKEAQRAGIAFSRRLAQLLIHAMVHVKGFDHKTQRAFRRMQRFENRLWTRFYEQ